MECSLDDISVINSPENLNPNINPPESFLQNNVNPDDTLNFSKIDQNENQIINNAIPQNQNQDIINTSLHSFIINIDKNKKTSKKLTKEELDNIPLPIFSCIYCSNDYVAFKHLSDELLSEKYLFQASNLDISQINNLLLNKNFLVRDDNNKLIKMIIENTEYLRKYYLMEESKKFFTSNNCENYSLINEKVYCQSLINKIKEDISRKKKITKYKSGLNKLNKNSLINTSSTINKCCTNATNTNSFTENNKNYLTNNLASITNTNNSNSSLIYFNSLLMNKEGLTNKNEIGVLGRDKNNNINYMENIIENEESINTIEGKNELLNILGYNNLKRKICKNNIEWEDNYYDIWNPNISNIDTDEKSLNKFCLNNCYIKDNNDNISKNKLNNLPKSIINRKKKLTLSNNKNFGSTDSSNNTLYKNTITTINNTNINTIKDSINLPVNDKNDLKDKQNKSLSIFSNESATSNNNNTNNSSKININNILNKIDVKSRTPSYQGYRKNKIIGIYKLNTNSTNTLCKRILFNNITNVNKKTKTDITSIINIKNLLNKNTRNYPSETESKNRIFSSHLSNLIKFNKINEGNEIWNKHNVLLTKINSNTYLDNFFNKTVGGIKINNKNNIKNNNRMFNLNKKLFISPSKTNKKQLLKLNCDNNKHLLTMNNVNHNKDELNKINIISTLGSDNDKLAEEDRSTTSRKKLHSIRIVDGRKKFDEIMENYHKRLNVLKG